MAYVYRKRGYWYVAYRTPSGWRRESLRTKKKRAAEKALPRFQRIEDSEIPTESSRISLADFVAYYLEYRRRRLSEPSFRSQEKYRIPKFVGFLTEAGIRMLDQVAERHVETYVEHLTRSCSPSYVRSTLALLGLMFRTACGWGMLDEDPSRNVRAPQVPDTRKSRALSEDEVETLLAAAEGTLIGPLVATAIYAGLRKAELINLEWKDIDWGAGFINNIHALRHTFLTMLTSRSSNLPAAQKMAGHARLSTTMRYVHVEDEVLKLEMAR